MTSQVQMELMFMKACVMSEIQKWQILTADKVDEYNSQCLARVAVNIK